MRPSGAGAKGMDPSRLSIALRRLYHAVGDLHWTVLAAVLLAAAALVFVLDVALRRIDFTLIRLRPRPAARMAA